MKKREEDEDRGEQLAAVRKALGRLGTSPQAAAVHAGVVTQEEMDDVSLDKLSAMQLLAIRRWANGQGSRAEG